MKYQSGALNTTELKYCERCGVLWLRRKGSERVYCAQCLPKVESLPDPGKKGRPRLPVLETKPEIKSSCIELFGLAEGGFE